MKSNLRKCMKCGKEKPESQGYLKLGGLFFCCKTCCGAEKKKGGNEKNVCEFC